MSSVPKGRADRLAFYESHVNTWVQNAEEMGVDPELAAELKNTTVKARQALDAQYRARQAARSATMGFNHAVRKMRMLGASMMSQIHGSAGLNGSQVYQLASISGPKKKSPVGQPGTPFGFDFKIDAIGRLKLTWKCRNPKNAEGTTYYIYRRVGAGGPLVYMGVAGKKRFIDATLPKGVTGVVYQIHAMRSKTRGDAAQFNVTIGTGRTLRQGIPVDSNKLAA